MVGGVSQEQKGLVHREKRVLLRYRMLFLCFGLAFLARKFVEEMYSRGHAVGKVCKAGYA